jgi:hypothetical protein
MARGRVGDHPGHQAGTRAPKEVAKNYLFDRLRVSSIEFFSRVIEACKCFLTPSVLLSAIRLIVSAQEEGKKRYSHAQDAMKSRYIAPISNCN